MGQFHLAIWAYTFFHVNKYIRQLGERHARLEVFPDFLLRQPIGNTLKLKALSYIKSTNEFVYSSFQPTHHNVLCEVRNMFLSYQ